MVVLVLFSLVGNLFNFSPTISSRSESDIEDSRLPDNLFPKKDVKKLLTTTNNAFTKNCGQLENDNVRFYIQGGGLWFTDDGVWFELREYAETRGRGSQIRGQDGVRVTPQTHTLYNSPNSQTHTQKYECVILKQEFVGANHVRPVGREPLDYYSNFFYGNDSSKWKIKVPSYQEIFYENLYDGIDLRYYQNNDGLKYDFIVHPGANPKQIKIKYKGASRIEIDRKGNLIITTRINEIIEFQPLVYQFNMGINKEVKGRFIKFNNFEYGFEILENYNKSKCLVIDPIVRLEYSTYIGGTNQDIGNAIAVDTMGNTYVTGHTYSSNFPTTPGTVNISYNGGMFDVFVSKLDPYGSKLIYSTYLGGSGGEIGYAIEIDLDSNIYVAGYTDSSDFPTTLGANDTSFNGVFDVFVLKMTPRGSSIIYSTFVGGGDGDLGFGSYIDSNGNIYVVGHTYSLNFPTTLGVYDTSFSGDADGFVFKLNQNGSSLVFSTYIGGSIDDATTDITIDDSGIIYVCGWTDSLDFPISSGAYDTLFNDVIDNFVLSLNYNGSIMYYSTFIGGNNLEYPFAIKIDSQGNAYITGHTISENYPTTPGAYDRINNRYDAFITKLNHNGSALIFSTFLGGDSRESGEDITIDFVGNVYVTGFTGSSNFPTTSYAFNKTHQNSDGFFVKLAANGSSLLYSTYIGGNNHDYGKGITLDSKGDVYITGYTNSLNFPTTYKAFNRTLSGLYDVFILKFAFRPIINITSVSLLMNSTSIKRIYSKLCPYTFKIEIINTVNEFDLSSVLLTLDLYNTNIKLLWDLFTDKFIKSSDPQNYVTIEPSCNIIRNSYLSTVYFNVTFNWNYPHEDFNCIQVYATSKTLSPAWFNASEFYCVENDLTFNGTLLVKGKENRTINENDLILGGTELTWTGLVPIYQNTTDVYPPVNEVNITLWDQTENSWADSPKHGEPFLIKNKIPNNSHPNGYNYTINLTGIPTECDKTNITFSIRIDGENVIFYNPIPNNKTWQTKSSFVTAGITITDFGGGEVKGSSVKYCSSIDDGDTWSDWEIILGLSSSVIVNPESIILFKEGINNLIKWKAEDTVGNGPVESEEYRILLDLKDVKFSNSYPLPKYESPQEEVEVGITISDTISGVNASSIEYAISHDSGKNWYSWMPIIGLKDENEINVSINLTFPNGTSNSIKWRASDIAGNGPKESSVYPIKVNTWLEEVSKPRVKLWNPPNSSIIPTTSVELSWRLENRNLENVTYDVYLDIIDPPGKLNQSDIINTSLILDNLINGVTYYWTVSPRIGSINGSCLSGVWTFTIAIPVPSVALVFPDNASIVQTVRPSLSWLANYDGTEKLTYDIYLDTNPSPNIWQRNIPNAYYIPKSNLEDNITYYWKIIPWAGEVRGIDSEIWSFTVKKYFLPRFDIQLVLEPSMIELKPSQMATVNAIVTNQGELTDTVSVSIEIPSDAEVGAIVNEPSTLDIISNGTKQFVLTVTTTEDIKKGEVILIVIATSEDAMEHDLVVEEKAELTVKILELDKHEPNKISLLFTFLNILFIVIVIIIILAIAIFVIKRKKREEEEPKPEEAVMVKPGEVTTPVLSIGEKPPLPQLSETTIKSSDTSQITTTTISTPQLPGTVPATVTPDSQQPPQLPPGQPQTLEIEANVTATVSTEKTPDSLTTQEP